MRNRNVLGLAVLVALGVSASAHAWVQALWSAQSLMDAANFVVIAKPVKEEVINTKPYEGGPDVTVDDVATTFEVIAVVKGKFQDTSIVLNFQRFTKPLETAGPEVINFEPGSGKRYLMFLRREPDGRTTSVSGLLNYAAAIIFISK